jgi:predicted XRE-type DNA-binding protein
MHVEYMKKPDIDKEKPDITLKRMSLTVKTKANIMRLNDSIKNDIFGRKEIMHILGLSASRSSELIKQMLDCDIIVAVKGQGKGKYIFK